MPRKTDRWLLPDGVDEILPPHAWRLERSRRHILDLFENCGYELVVPPLIEYLESLLTGSASDLELQTFKVTDLMSGRLMGIRVDMTSQAARIDAHVLPHDGVTRLCYAGSVLHAAPGAPFESRCPILIGAELFGAEDPHADAEVITLAGHALAAAGVTEARIELGHVGLFAALARAAEIDEDTEQRLFECVQAKSEPDIVRVLSEAGVPSAAGDFVDLTGFLGGEEVVAEARQRFRRSAKVIAALDDLEKIVELLAPLPPGVTLQFDLSELRGYSYHTGVVFAAYTADQGRAFLRGGRYDHVGEVFGRRRPATGFDADLLTLASYSDAVPPEAVFAATWDADDPSLDAFVTKLRAAGEVVVCGFAADTETAARCPRIVERRAGAWQVVANPALQTDRGANG